MTILLYAYFVIIAEFLLVTFLITIMNPSEINFANDMSF